MTIASTMRAWQYFSNGGGITPNLRLNITALVPAVKGSKDMLVRVLAVGLNPVDHRPAESILYPFAIPKPATPGTDFAGEVVQGPANAAFHEGDMVFGSAKNIFAGGMLAEYGIANTDQVISIGQLSPTDAAAIPIAGLTAYQSIFPRIKPNSRIFINGGSGGTGTFGIQIAKAMGHKVTVSCSSRNAELCRSLGAEVIDYTEGLLLHDLKEAAKVRKFDLVVDNVFTNPELYWKAHEYTNEGAPYIVLPFNMTASFMVPFLSMKLLPRFMGGGQRTLTQIFGQPKLEQLEQIRDWVTEKRVKVVLDQVVPFEQTKQAFERLTSGRTVGKIVVEVAEASATKSKSV